MKYSSLLLLLIGSLSVAWAAPQEDMEANARLRRDVIRLFKEDKDAAVALLRTNVRSEARGGRKDAEVVQQLVDIAFHFDARREDEFAWHAAASAVTTADSLLRHGTPTREEAYIFGNVGLVAERILRERNLAKKYYVAALSADPDNQQAKQRAESLAEKTKRRLKKN